MKKTAHIILQDDAKIAKVVVFPGDPIRAKNFADQMLTDIIRFNGVRGMYGYTGKYKDKWITVHPSGMGFGSSGIYAYEFWKFFGVQTIIRMGSSGAYRHNINLKDLFYGESGYTENNFSFEFTGKDKSFIQYNEHVYKKIIDAAKENDISVSPVQIHSTELYYCPEKNIWERFWKEGHMVDVAECEAFALQVVSDYLNETFDNLNTQYASILFASNNIATGEKLSPEERETSLDNLFKLTAEAAYKFA